MVWAGIMTNARTPVHTFEGGSNTGERFCTEILEGYVCHFHGAVGRDFVFIGNFRPHRSAQVAEVLECENIAWSGLSIRQI